jgi:AbrB family looped-hinge helix DNA binding protein
MVTIATITHKNQLTIPKEFVEKTNLKGSRKVLLEKKGKSVVIKPLKSSVDELAGSLYDPNRKSVSRKKERELVQKLISKKIAKEGV